MLDVDGWNRNCRNFLQHTRLVCQRFMIICHWCVCVSYCACYFQRWKGNENVNINREYLHTLCRCVKKISVINLAVRVGPCKGIWRCNTRLQLLICKEQDLESRRVLRGLSQTCFRRCLLQMWLSKTGCGFLVCLKLGSVFVSKSKYCTRDLWFFICTILSVQNINIARTCINCHIHKQTNK